ncbi:MAG: cadmium resistance transporter [Lachnospiraceae bacterium]
MTSTFLTAILSFASTNIDDIFILTILFAQVQNPKGTVQIIAGQYAGIGALAALSILGAMGTQLFPPQYIGLLGFLPLFLGVRSWLAYRRGQDHSAQETPKNTQIRFVSVFLLTIANGADNIGVYIPVFSGYTVPDFIITLAVFSGMTALWCYLGLTLANYPYIKQKITRYQHVLVPLVLIALGLAILAKHYIP